MTTSDYNALIEAASDAALEALARSVRKGARDWAVISGYHRAASLRLHAAESIDDLSARAWNYLEAIGLFLDGLDPVRARQVSSHPSLNGKIPDPLERRVKRDFADFAQIWMAFLKRNSVSGSFRHIPEEEAHQLAEALPGIPHSWWILYRAYDRAEKQEAAASALRKASELEPAYPKFRAMWIFAESRYLPWLWFQRSVAAVVAEFSGKSFEVDHMYAVALLKYAREEGSEAILREAALSANRASQLLEDATGQRRSLAVALVSFIQAKLNRVPPSAAVEELRQAGLIEQASESPDDAELEAALSRLPDEPRLALTGT